MQIVKSGIVIKAPIKKVWDMMTHHEGMVDWPEVDKVKIVQQGSNHPDGLGCIREVNAKGMFVREEITRYDINQQMDYMILKTNLPINHKGGSIVLSQVDGGVKVDWESRMDVTIKNPITKFIAKKMIPKKGKKGFDEILEWVKAELEE